VTDSIRSWNEHEERAIREQLNTVLASPLFTHAERLGRFLRFVVCETLSGSADRINQYAIAIEVFDRDETFDPTIDAIVRVEAGRLRSKLLEYYDNLGRDDPIRLELPKRKYEATFRRRSRGDVRRAREEENADAEIFSGYDAAGTAKLPTPTIAVLPFVNMSPDPEQEYFADGVTEDLITDLSRVPGIAVISRHSTFSYKGTANTVQQVCKELGANLVLEGSVRKVMDKVRITAQLIEGSSGQHLWAQRYDRDVENIFEIQDEVNRKIVNACSLKLSEGEQEKGIRQKPTEVVDAYDYVLRGIKETRANSIEGTARARYCFESALKLDPNYAAAHARMALNYLFRWVQGWNEPEDDCLVKGLEFALKAVALDDKLAMAHAALCWAYLWHGEHDKAISEGQVAIDLDPDDVLALERLAFSMIFAGLAESSLPLIEKAKRLNPNFAYDFVHGVAMFMMGNYEEAIKSTRISFESSVKFVPAGLYLAASHALAGNQSEAEETVAKILNVNPSYQLTEGFLSQFKFRKDCDLFIGAVRQAGLN